MTPFPIHIDLRDRPCLVVGGGEVGTRKTVHLCRSDARITVISPETSETLGHLADEKRITWYRRGYCRDDVSGKFLVFAATNDSDVNRQVAIEARRAGALVSVADDPELGDFSVPAVVSQGDLMITVSTGGKSPALSRILRQSLARQFGPEYGQALDLLGRLRQKLLTSGHDPDRHRRQFRQILNQGLVETLKAGDTIALQALLLEVFGEVSAIDISDWTMPAAHQEASTDS